MGEGEVLWVPWRCEFECVKRFWLDKKPCSNNSQDVCLQHAAKCSHAQNRFLQNTEENVVHLKGIWVSLKGWKISIINAALQYCSLICIIYYNSSNAFYKNLISHKFLQCGFSQLYLFKMWKQLAILCVYIPSVHHLKEKTVSLAMLWLINTSRCSRDKLEKYQSLTRYRPRTRSGLWKRFPFHCYNCWNDWNLLFFSCLKKKKSHLEPFVGLYSSSVKAWSQIWLEISGQSSNDFGGLKSSEIALM